MEQARRAEVLKQVRSATEQTKRIQADYPKDNALRARLASVRDCLLVVIAALELSGCSTANNYKLPPWEVKRQEMTCDRKTTGLPHGLVCVCRQYGSTWDCQVARIE